MARRTSRGQSPLAWVEASRVSVLLGQLVGKVATHSGRQSATETKLENVWASLQNGPDSPSRRIPRQHGSLR